MPRKKKEQQDPVTPAEILAEMLSLVLPGIALGKLEQVDRKTGETLRSVPLVAVWDACRHHACQNATVVFGSPHGGPVIKVLVSEVDASSRHTERHRLGRRYDDGWARTLGISLETFQAQIQRGDIPEGYTVYPNGPGDTDDDDDLWEDI